MYAYSDWIFGGALTCHPKITFAWCAAIIFLLLVLDLIGALKFTLPWSSEMAAKHGKSRIALWENFLAITLGPLLEELIFRGPVLWFCINGDVRNALTAAFAGAIIFGLVHRTSSTKFADGTKVPYPWIAILLITFSGLSCGCLVFISKSLWPAIAYHGLWNLLTTVSESSPIEIRLADIARKWN